MVLVAKKEAILKNGFMKPKTIVAESHVVYSSPSPSEIFSYSPSLEIGSSRRFIVTLDRGGIMRHSTETGLILTSDDEGLTWQPRNVFSFIHARCFHTPRGIYVIGHKLGGNICIAFSHDNGTTWSQEYSLTDNMEWHAAPTNVLYANNRIYMIMEKQRCSPHNQPWPVGWLAPVVLSAEQDADLTNKDAWSFSNDDLIFQDIFHNIKYLSVPFFPIGKNAPMSSSNSRYNAPPGWLEGNILQIIDPKHCLYGGKHVFHILMRCHTGGLPNIACLLVAREDSENKISIELEKSPSGQECTFIPLPGGHNKFYIVYDDLSDRYFLASSISNDSMTTPAQLSPERYNIPLNERRYLGLYVSRNLIDWNFLTIVDAGKRPMEARNYPSIIIDNDDLLILSRSGDKHSICAHNSNQITLHKLKHFRELLEPWH